MSDREELLNPTPDAQAQKLANEMIDVAALALGKSYPEMPMFPYAQRILAAEARVKELENTIVLWRHVSLESLGPRLTAAEARVQSLDGEVAIKDSMVTMLEAQVGVLRAGLAQYASILKALEGK